MKICIVTHKLIKGDGQGKVNYEIAWAAIRNGHQLTRVEKHCWTSKRQSYLKLFKKLVAS